MSDDRFTREPGDDDDTHVPTPKKPKFTFHDVKPRTVTAEEVDAFLDDYCKKMGIKRDKKPLRGRP